MSRVLRMKWLKTDYDGTTGIRNYWSASNTGEHRNTRAFIMPNDVQYERNVASTLITFMLLHTWVLCTWVYEGISRTPAFGHWSLSLKPESASVIWSSRAERELDQRDLVYVAFWNFFLIQIVIVYVYGNCRSLRSKISNPTTEERLSEALPCARLKCLNLFFIWTYSFQMRQTVMLLCWIVFSEPLFLFFSFFLLWFWY